MPRKVKVPLYGNVNRAAFLEDGATVGAKFGVNLYYADGSIVTLANLADALDLTQAAQPDNGVTSVVWGFIQEIPFNIQQAAALAGQGLVTRRNDGTWTVRSIVAGSAKITVSQGDGNAGNPTIDFGTVNLEDLANVVFPTGTPLEGDVLTFDGSDWTGREPSSGYPAQLGYAGVI